MRKLLGAIHQAVSAPRVTGMSFLTADGKLRTIDTLCPLRTAINEAIDPNCNVTERRLTLTMAQHTTLDLGNSWFDSATGAMLLAVAPTANDTQTIDNTYM